MCIEQKQQYKTFCGDIKEKIKKAALNVLKRKLGANKSTIEQMNWNEQQELPNHWQTSA